ncbi:phospholipase, partial [Candidatus Hydrogenedentota bacterium]
VRGNILSVSDAVNLWVAQNGCDVSPTTKQLPDTDPDDETRVWVDTYGGSNADAEVILYRVVGGGHSWPGDDNPLSEDLFGRTSQDIDATEVVWEFFKEH